MKQNEYFKDRYEVDFGLTLLFLRIYGEDEYDDFKDYASLKDFKEKMSKLIITIKKAFIQTCTNTDKNHVDTIENLINEESSKITNAKSINELHTNLIIFYPKLCLLLIGQVPENSSKRKKDNRSKWILNEHRQLEYKQTRNQKFELFRNLLRNERIKGLGSYSIELENYKKSKVKGEDMFEWFKRKHPEKYFNLFDRTE